MTQKKTTETQTAEKGTQSYKLTYGHTSESVKSANGISDRQIEAIVGILDVQISRSPDAPEILNITSTKSSTGTTVVEDVLIAADAVKYTLENNLTKPRELSINNIKREIKNIRAALRIKRAEQKPSVSGEFETQAAPANVLRVKAKAHQPPVFPLSTMLEDGSVVINGEKTLIPTPGQQKFLEHYDNSEAIIIDGPAGSGKTEFAIYMALRDLKLGHIKRIILSASVQKGVEDPGWLPGELEDKMSLTINQMLEKFDKHLGAGNLEEGKKIREPLQKKGLIQIRGLGDLGGESFEDAVLIIDEAHQACEEHLNIAIGRLENPEQKEGAPLVRKNAKAIFCGHTHQNTTENGESVYANFLKKFQHPEYQGFVTCLEYSAEDVRRSKLLEIMARLGHDISEAERKKAIRDQYGPKKVDQIITNYFNAVAQGKITDTAQAQKLKLYVSKLVGTIDKIDLAMLAEAELNSLDGGPA